MRLNYCENSRKHPLVSVDQQQADAASEYFIMQASRRRSRQATNDPANKVMQIQCLHRHQAHFPKQASCCHASNLKTCSAFFIYCIHLMQQKASASRPRWVCSPLLIKKEKKCRNVSVKQIAKMNLSLAKCRVHSHRVNKVQVDDRVRCNSSSAIFKT